LGRRDSYLLYRNFENEGTLTITDHSRVCENTDYTQTGNVVTAPGATTTVDATSTVCESVL
jgi:hypothetical protein